MAKSKLKLYTYEITFIISSKLSKNNLVKLLTILSKYILKNKGIIMDIELALKTSEKYRTFRLKKLANSSNIIYNNLNKKYLCSIYLKINPFLLKELLYNLKLRKILSRYICIKTIKHY